MRNSNNRKAVKSILLVKKFLGLVEMTSWVVNSYSLSLPEWQAVKMIFFAPCILNQELGKVVRNGYKVVRCLKFPTGRTFNGDYGYWKSHTTLKLKQ